MKKLSVEEKAEAYDEAIVRANKVLLDCTIEERNVVEFLLPKLAESEDERIRKSLIGHLKECRNNTRSEVMIGEYAKWIAWLEKQKQIDILDEEERKFADDVDSHRKEINEAYQKGYNEGVKVTLEKQGEQKLVFGMKTPEESLGIDSDTYNKIVDECIYSEQNPSDKVEPNMTQEEKQLLLQDLSTRLPYGVLCVGITYELDDDGEKYILVKVKNTLTEIDNYNLETASVKLDLISSCKLETVKPYLRPMASMTEEESYDYYDTFEWEEDLNGGHYPNSKTEKTFDWLLSHHFDYRGLIEKGLAIEAPEDMYN